MPRPILISACLLGLQTRYDGCSKFNAKVMAYLEANELLPIPVCPEQLGGLPTPRPPARFVRGDGNAVLDGRGEIETVSGLNRNAAFRAGAAETLRIARLTGCKEALLKERSPSCGVHRIYQGDRLIAGEGVASALLRREGIRIQSEEEL
ncbi:MAG: DUF523 domain-containing protein [Desulfuromonadaceae bacterium]